MNQVFDYTQQQEVHNSSSPYHWGRIKDRLNLRYYMHKVTTLRIQLKSGPPIPLTTEELLLQNHDPKSKSKGIKESKLDTRINYPLVNKQTS